MVPCPRRVSAARLEVGRRLDLNKDCQMWGLGMGEEGVEIKVKLTEHMVLSHETLEDS